MRCPKCGRTDVAENPRTRRPYAHTKPVPDHKYGETPKIEVCE